MDLSTGDAGTGVSGWERAVKTKKARPRDGRAFLRGCGYSIEAATIAYS